MNIKMSKSAPAKTCTFHTDRKKCCIFQEENNEDLTQRPTCTNSPEYHYGGRGRDDHQLCDKRRSLMAKASDTDIICIAVSFPRDWSIPAVNCMWPSQHWRWISVHELCVSIGPQKSRSIHAFTNHGIRCCV